MCATLLLQSAWTEDESYKSVLLSCTHDQQDNTMACEASAAPSCAALRNWHFLHVCNQRLPSRSDTSHTGCLC